MPSLVVGSQTIRLLSPRYQIATALGLELPERLGAVRLAWDITRIQEVWRDLVGSVDWEALTMPTPSQGRTPVDLVANVFAFYAATEDAWIGRPDSWAPPSLLAEQTAARNRLRDPPSAVAFIEERLAAWQLFVEHLAEADPEGKRAVPTPEGGTLLFLDLLDMQRQHGAQHLRQVLYTYDQAGIMHAGRDPRELVPNLELPEHPF